MPATTSFKDHFSGHADAYARYRPTYPLELFRFLAAEAPDRGCAWDCATGNGQVAISLAQFFDRVIATDASSQQIDQARGGRNVEFRAAPAEASGLPAASVALVTVGQALHWFDLDAFYAEARRVLKPDGVLAAWSYALAHVNPEVDRVVEYLIDDLTGPWWPPERKLVDEGYASLPFPFSRIDTPAFDMRTNWNYDQFSNYLRTWSGVQRYLKDTGRDPVGEVDGNLRSAWGDPDTAQSVTWPLAVRAGRP
ncbi:MAG TPA: class I SAM-dependent methyltransferase [Gammaproteobacteria bacterium]|nr:class I SAM-dependent methyltransferase [Gammaproteobacteria bacterium]